MFYPQDNTVYRKVSSPFCIFLMQEGFLWHLLACPAVRAHWAGFDFFFFCCFERRSAICHRFSFLLLIQIADLMTMFGSSAQKKTIPLLPKGEKGRSASREKEKKRSIKSIGSMAPLRFFIQSFLWYILLLYTIRYHVGIVNWHLQCHRRITISNNIHRYGRTYFQSRKNIRQLIHIHYCLAI